MHPLTIYKAPAGLRHDTGPGHPERAERLETLFALFDETPFDTWPHTDAQPATPEQITRAHPESYVMRIEDSAPDRGSVMLDGDTVMSAGTLDAAYESAGAVCMAVDDVIDGKTRRAFCAVRPPGHHAEPTRAMGFCLFNNIFIGAMQARARGIDRVAIVDFDVHHGNGTDAMARKHDGVLFISTHQWPLYPGTGGPDDQIPGRVINLPMNAGGDGAAYDAVFRDRVIPALDDYRPGLIMISAGFDAHRDDPLAGMNLTDDDFGHLTRLICGAADRLCAGRVVSVLEGGYDLTALKNGASAHIRALAAEYPS